MYWKDHQHEFPILASLARDVLTTPASGSGVERLFNSARDICHYRRGSLKPKTIRDLMMFMCTTKFDMESEQLFLIEEYLSAQETEVVREEKEIRKAEEEFNPISDTEEDPLATISQPTEPVSQRALGKRPRTEAAMDDPGPLIESNEDDEIPLPDNSHIQGESTQRRSSGRLPKRPRQDEDFVYGKP